MRLNFDFLKDKKIVQAIVFFSILLIAMIVMSVGAGMNGDEEMQATQANNVLNYYKTFGKDTAAVSTTIMKNGNPEYWNLPLYGQVIDNLAEFVAQVFRIEDVMMTRHVVNSIFGWLGILFASLMAFRISGQRRAAVFTALLLFLSPRFLGHSFNNIKDVSFATAMMMGVYYITVFLQEFPKPKRKTVIMLIISIAFAMAVRVPGILLIPYFGLFALIWLVRQYIENKKSEKSNVAKKKIKTSIPKEQTIAFLFKKMLKYGIGIFVVAYVLMVLMWPYAIESPISHVKEAFSGMAKFSTAIRQNFEGQLFWSDALPWYYTPKYILMTIPIAVILGSLLYLFAGGLKKENRFTSFIIYFSFVFPIFWIVYSNANVYGGWRHSLFAYLPMVVTAGLGFSALVDLVKNKYAKIALTALPLVLLINPFVHIIKNHPYEYVYFNELVGGVKKVYGNYEMDYYYHSTREASEWIKANAEKKDGKIMVATWHPASVNYYFRKDTNHFSVGFTRWYERGNVDWDYAIFVITGISPSLQKSNFFPPKNTVHTIDVDGKPICLILKRTDKSDMIGHQIKERLDSNMHQLTSYYPYDTALFHLKKAVELDPTNEAAAFNAIEIYLNTNRADSAKIYIDKMMNLDPRSEISHAYLINYYTQKNELDLALQTCDILKTINPTSLQAHLIASQLYMRKGLLAGAENELMALVEIGQANDYVAQQLVRIYQMQGMSEHEAVKKLYMVLAEGYKNRGREDLYLEYMQAYERM